MKIDLGGRSIDFVSSDRWHHAMLDGKRIPIRLRYQSRRISTYEPKPYVHESETSPWCSLPTPLVLIEREIPEYVGDCAMFRVVQKAGPRTLCIGKVEMHLDGDVLAIAADLEVPMLRLDLGGPVLDFIRVKDPEGRAYSSCFAAELDGVRVPLRVRRTDTEVGYSSRHGEEISDEEGLAVLLWDLDEELPSEPKCEGDTFVFEIDSVRHYNSYKRGRVTIAYRDGIVHWDADIEEKNDSFY